MELVAIILCRDCLDPIPIFVQENMIGDSITVKGSQSGYPASPFENIPAYQSVPAHDSLSLHEVVHELISSTHKGLHVLGSSHFKMVHFSDHGALDLPNFGELVPLQVPAATAPEKSRMHSTS